MSESFKAVFLQRLQDVEVRAKACGLTMTHLCRAKGIARATPDRWKKKPPKSIQLMDDLEAVVVEAEKARANRAKTNNQ